MHFLIQSFLHLRFKHTILMTKDCPQNNVRQLGDNFIFFYFLFIYLVLLYSFLFLFFFFFFWGGGGGEVYRRIYISEISMNFLFICSSPFWCATIVLSQVGALQAALTRLPNARMLNIWLNIKNNSSRKRIRNRGMSCNILCIPTFVV